MTITLPDQDTDTARQILEHAELEPPCENPKGCARAAGWILHFANKPCGCRFSMLACQSCKDHVIESQANDEQEYRWKCRSCDGVIGPCTYRDATEVDAEPLR